MNQSDFNHILWKKSIIRGQRDNTTVRCKMFLFVLFVYLVLLMEHDLLLYISIFQNHFQKQKPGEVNF